MTGDVVDAALIVAALGIITAWWATTRTPEGTETPVPEPEPVECGAAHCHRPVGPDAPHPYFCSHLCWASFSRGTQPEDPVRAEGMPAPKLRSMLDPTMMVAGEKPSTANLAAAFPWLDSRARS